MKTIITKDQLLKLESGRVREDKKKQGFFDGRFVTRTQDSKKKYSRKEKHKSLT